MFHSLSVFRTNSKLEQSIWYIIDINCLSISSRQYFHIVWTLSCLFQADNDWNCGLFGCERRNQISNQLSFERKLHRIRILWDWYKFWEVWIELQVSFVRNSQIRSEWSVWLFISLNFCGKWSELRWKQLTKKGDKR